MLASPKGAVPRHPLLDHNPTCPEIERQGFSDKNKERKGMLLDETKQIVLKVCSHPLVNRLQGDAKPRPYQLSDEPLLHPTGLQS